MEWAILIAFLSVQVGLGAWAARRVDSEADYFVAGRKLGTPLLAMSLFATWFGAETCLGSSGAIYESGLSGGRADPLGYCLCLVLVGVFFARTLRERGYLTLGDLYRDAFGQRVERLAILLLVPSALVWGAAQVRAFGQVLAQTTHLPVTGAVIVAASLATLYTFFGGLLGDVLTDLVQGSIVALGLSLLLVLVLLSADLDAANASTWLSAQRLSVAVAGESMWVQLDRFAVPVFGSLVTQELFARVLAARSPSAAVAGSYYSAGIYLAVGAIPVVLGLMGPALLPALPEPEQLLPSLAHRYMPPALAWLFTCALLSAILSTIDSILLSSAALVSHNLLSPLLRNHSDRMFLLLGRLLVLLFGGICLVIALYAEGIYELVESASALGTAGIVVITLAAVLLPRQSARGALGALLVGALATPVLQHYAFAAPFLASLALSALSYGVLLFVEKERGASTAPAP